MTFKLLLDGMLVDGFDTLDIVNPATGQVFATAPRANATHLDLAIAAANKAFTDWSARRYADRGDHLRHFADAVEARFDDLARLLTQEQGKPLAEARHEIGASIAALRHFADQELGPRTLRETPDEHIVEQHYPLGVVAAIIPWNFPILLLTLKLAPALITGNTVIAKPAPTTPLTTLLLGNIAADILPPGVFQTIVDDNDLGALLTGHPGIAYVSFTGSTATGRKVLSSASQTLKRFNLELGGNDVAIVLDDADIEVVAPAIFQSAMLNAGQICLATKRLYVPRTMIDAVCAALRKLADDAVVGDGLAEGTTIGPIQNEAQYVKILALIEQARADGTIIAGDRAVASNGFFIAPTIVRDLDDDAPLVCAEQFGPVLPVLAYDNIDEVVLRANRSEYGLGGSIWTSDVTRGMAVAARIESGTVWVNKHLDLPFDVAFGGAKQSGIGRQNGVAGMEDFTQSRIINAAKPSRMVPDLTRNHSLAVFGAGRPQ